MYFPTTSAKVLRPSAASTPHDLPLLPASLADIARLGGAHDEVLLSFARQGDSSWRGRDKTGRSRKLAAVVGGSEIGIWSLRPALLLCKLKRTGTSLRRYGLNKEVHWVDDESSGSCRLLVSTTKSFLFLYSVSLYDASPNAPVYSVPSTGTGAAKGQFVAGSGEGLSLPALVIHEVGYLDFTEFEVTSFCPAPQFLVVATANPPALQTLHYALFTDELHHLEQDDTSELEHIMYLSEQPWIVDPQSPITDIQYNSQLDLYALIAADGRAYAIKNLSSDSSHNHMERRGSEASNTNFPSLPAPLWDGQCFYGSPESDIGLEDSGSTSKILPLAHKATCIAFNVPFSLVAVGLQDGQCVQYSILMPSQALTYSHRFHLRQTLKSTSPHLETGSVRCLTWTSDGYALALGWEQGWAVWTVYGRLTTWAVGGDAGGAEGGEQPASFQDRFMNGIKELFWAPGNFELFALCDPPEHPKERAVDEQLFIIPFAKSAVTSLHTPDNTNHAFLQLDDGLLVYRGADQPDMSVINPESDVWQSIKLPAAYVSNNWPMRYACISADARLIAVAGRRGLVHYNSLSGRWKLFDSGIQEQSFKVQGGMQWYGSTLIVTAEEQDEHDQTVYTLRLFGRDRALNTAYALDEEVLPSRVVLTSLFDSSLLVYTEDNTFYHFLLASTKNGPRLRLCGSIGFEGVVTDPTKVRGLSWMVPPSQQRFGDPSDDLNFATVIFLIEGRLVLLRPRRAIKEEVKYDMQILADRIEFYWTHLTGIGTLENSLWGWDGEQIRVWLNALTIDVNKIADRTSHGELETVEESLAIKIDFYPLSVLMDKGIIVGVEHETCFRRSLDFAIFRLTTNTHLFIHHVLRFHLSRSQTREAVVFASHYQHLVYFAHALEILLHAVLEDEADSLPNSSLHLPPLQTALSISTGPKVPKNAVLPVVVDFLDHFTEALQVVVNCARKTEITRWAYLFQFVGKPRDLFEICMRGGQLKIAASYLLVLHNLEPLEQSSKDTVSLLKAAMAKDDWQLCKELSRFLFSLDHTGAILQSCLSEAGAMPPAYANKMPTIRRAVSMPMGRSNSTPGRTSSPGTGGSSHFTSASTSLSPINSLGASLPSSAAPFARTGTTARAMHYRMSSGSGLGLGTNTRGMTNPHERLRRSLSAQGSSLPGILQESISEKEADDDP